MRLFNPPIVKSTYAIAKVQEVLWKKNGSCIQDSIFHNSGSHFHHTGGVTRTIVNSNCTQNPLKIGVPTLQDQGKYN